MHYLVIVTLLAIFSVIHFTEHPRLLPALMAFVPEILGALVLLYVVIAGSKTRFKYVRAEYWLVFGGIAAVMVCGIFANGVGPGPIFAGLRYYLRPIPLFFLPAVFLFSEKQIRQQLRLITILCLIQLPLAVQERMTVMEQGRFSGDSVVGSVEDSSALSIILISAVCILTAMTMRGQISRGKYLLLFFILLLPTTINETKATLILLPIGLLITMLVAAPPARRLRVLFGATTLLVVFFVMFAPVYDYMQRNNPYRVPITDFFLDPTNFERYLDNHADQGSTHVARMDGLKIPMAYLVKEPSRLAFGLGIGNASHSQLGEQFMGRYYIMFGRFELSALTMFLLELGTLGTALIFVLYWLIFKDSLVVARTDPGMMGAVAAAWAGITAITVISMPYKTSFVFPSLSILFWYLSGLVAARRMYLAIHGAAAEQPVPLRAVAAPPQRVAGAIRSR